jgi:diaminobutyrate-2-oxoglutarate transaminase
VPAAFDGDLGPDEDTSVALDAQLGRMAQEGHAAAAVILETVQAEGGIRVATDAWLGRVADVARRHGALLIVDDIQVGCGRTGPFFSFEPSRIVPDIVCLSKSIGGLGLPMSLVLIRPEHDGWLPGEHNGTFRGNNLAFVAATEALGLWRDGSLQRETIRKGARVRACLERMACARPEGSGAARGRGLIQGVAFGDVALARRVSQVAFLNGLLVETCGPEGRVLKLLPPLTISDVELELGLQLLEEAFEVACDLSGERAPPSGAAQAHTAQPSRSP